MSDDADGFDQFDRDLAQLSFHLGQPLEEIAEEFDTDLAGATKLVYGPSERAGARVCRTCGGAVTSGRRVTCSRACLEAAVRARWGRGSVVEG